jgi:hypothetical protein
MGAFASHSGLHTVRVGRVLSARVGLRLIETHFRVGLVGVDCASNSSANFRARGALRAPVWTPTLRQEDAACPLLIGRALATDPALCSVSN